MWISQRSEQSRFERLALRLRIMDVTHYDTHRLSSEFGIALFMLGDRTQNPLWGLACIISHQNLGNAC